MDADFSVELGPPSEEATLDMPWESGTDEGPRYFDVKRHPELLQFVPEAVQYPELGQFLRALNSGDSVFETAKCDVWLSDELSEAEDIYEAECKLGSYVDVLFSDTEPAARFSFFRYEDLARSLVNLLERAPEIPASAEFIVRRCFYHSSGARDEDVSSGFYLTCYVFGYGNDEDEARQRWAAALQFVAAAMRQLSGASGTPPPSHCAC